MTSIRTRTWVVATAALLLSAGTGVLPATAAEDDTARARVVLGRHQVFGEYSSGWGTVKPRVIDNGGVPSGRAHHLRWRRWGEPRAKARGLIPLYKPSGGYYRKPGRIVLRAQRIRRCGGKRAYTRLYFRIAKKPGEPVSGPWRPWLGGNICSWSY